MVKPSTRRSRRGLPLVVVLLASALGLACATSDLLVGDDTTLRPAAEAGPTPFVTDAGAKITDDALPPCAAPDELCVATGGTCAETAPGKSCPNASDTCCKACKMLTPPTCPGDAAVPRYDDAGCIRAFACPPVHCTVGPGECITPADCIAGTVDYDASIYYCIGNDERCCY